MVLGQLLDGMISDVSIGVNIVSAYIVVSKQSRGKLCSVRGM